MQKNRMKNAAAAFRAYLERAGRLEAIPLGEAAEHAVRPTEKDNLFLQEQIGAAAGSTNWMLCVMMVMLVITFAIGAFLVLRVADSIGAVATISGGTLSIMLVIVERLRRLWIEKAMLDIAWAGIREWPPESVLALVELLYWHSVRSRRKRSTESRELKEN